MCRRRFVYQVSNNIICQVEIATLNLGGGSNNKKDKGHLAIFPAA